MSWSDSAPAPPGETLERLYGVLDEETRCCEALAGVLREEQQAVVHLRPTAIFACLAQRQALQEELERLVAARRALVQHVASARGARAESASALLPLLPITPRERLRGRIHALRRSLLEARSLERQQERLLSSSLDGVSELLRTLRALVPGARYGADAQIAGSPGAAERVDRRA